MDGTNPGGLEASSSNGAAWVVEAVGTFVGVDPQTDRVEAIGTHGFQLWADDGSETSAFYPYWNGQGLCPMT